MIVKLLTEHHLACLSLSGGCRGSSESTHVKMPHCWNSHALAHFLLYLLHSTGLEYLLSAGNRLSRRDLTNAVKHPRTLYQEFWVSGTM